jgi:hypothetical protein
MLNRYGNTLCEVFDRQVSAVKSGRIKLQLIIRVNQVIISSVFKGERDNTEIYEIRQMNAGKRFYNNSPDTKIRRA